MWPWSHLVVGYVAYSLWYRTSKREPPTDVPALLCVFGTQFPDLVDKPLAWTFGVIPNGRSLTHSAISATLVVAVYLYYTHRRGCIKYATAFGVGYYSHLFGDALRPFLNGSSWGLSFLLWPILPAVEYNDGGFFAHLARLNLTPLFAVQLSLIFLPAVLLWIADGTPGTALLTWGQNPCDTAVVTSQSPSGSP